MGSIRPFIRNKAFHPEALKAMAEAFDKATAFMTDHTDEATEILAVRIISMASTGERDPDKLAATALSGFCTGASAQ